LPSDRLKLLSALIIIVVVVGGSSFYFTTRKGTESQSITVTPTETMVKPERPTEWITIRQVKPINYYLSLLESNGTAPYIQLAKDLQKLPDLTNPTAVAKITFLALNATNPEVKEAFELMIKGGTPDLGDFKYRVPEYNTQLQVLYWLASQNEFKRDDTLVLALATANGFWVTIGDEEVRQAVKRDTGNLLPYFRETNELQKRRGHPLLEDYPLEAKICLTWTANAAPYGFVPLRTHTPHPAIMIFFRSYLSPSTPVKSRVEAASRFTIAYGIPTSTGLALGSQSCKPVEDRSRGHLQKSLPSWRQRSAASLGLEYSRETLISGLFAASQSF